MRERERQVYHEECVYTLLFFYCKWLFKSIRLSFRKHCHFCRRPSHMAVYIYILLQVYIEIDTGVFLALWQWA